MRAENTNARTSGMQRANSPPTIGSAFGRRSNRLGNSLVTDSTSSLPRRQLVGLSPQHRKHALGQMGLACGRDAP